jgi:hypothetical protein
VTPLSPHSSPLLLLPSLSLSRVLIVALHLIFVQSFQTVHSLSSRSQKTDTTPRAAFHQLIRGVGMPRLTHRRRDQAAGSVPNLRQRKSAALERLPPLPLSHELRHHHVTWRWLTNDSSVSSFPFATQQ